MTPPGGPLAGGGTAATMPAGGILIAAAGEFMILNVLCSSGVPAIAGGGADPLIGVEVLLLPVGGGGEEMSMGS